MKKNRFLIIITLFLCFFVFCKNVKALPVCDFENNYGTLETRTQKEVNDMDDMQNNMGAYSTSTNLFITTAGPWSTDPKKFYWVYAMKGGYIKTAKFTIYSDDGTGKYNGKAQCEYSVDVTKKCKEAEGQTKCETFKFWFDFNKKHVLHVRFTGTYCDSNDSCKSFGTKKFLVYKTTDGTGVDHTTIANTTTSTAKNKHIDSGDEKSGGTGVAGTLKAKNTKKDVIKTDEDGNIIMSGSTSCTDVSDIIHDYWSYVMVIVPILLIIMMTLDFFKAIGSNDADVIKKAGTNSVKRTLAAVILLALPVLLSFIFGLFGLDLCV